MIIESAQKDVVVSSSRKSRSFNIHASPKAFEIISSGIYTHKIRAIIREISCNAYDAHVATNNPANFDVHLPTSFEPWFNVRDYGPGLSDDHMRGENSVYTNYFFSTKTSSDDYIGAMGLGSKSPFCKVDSFMVTSYHDGWKRVYSCYKNEDGTPDILLMSEEPTVEPTGLSVFVNVEKEDVEEYKQEAINIFKYFKKLPNINIKDVKVAIEEYHNSMRIKSEEVRSTLKSGNVVAVMGNVAYNVPYEYFKRSMHAELHFPIGAISFDPGRENLSLDKKTIAAITEAANKLSENIADYIEQDIESQPTDFEKYVSAVSYIQSYDGVIRRRVEKIVDKYEPKCDNHNVYISGYRRVEYYVKKNAVWTDSKSEYYLHQDKMTSRIKQYVKTTGKTVVVLTQEQIDKAGIPPYLIKDLKTLPKVVRATSTVKRGDVYTIEYNGSYVYKKDFVGALPTEQKIYFQMERNGYSYKYDKSINKVIEAAKELGLLKKDTVLYAVTKTYSNKKSFQTDNWLNFEDYVQQNLDKFSNVEIEDISDLAYSKMIEIGRQSKAPAKYKDLVKQFDKIKNKSQQMYFDILQIPYAKSTKLKEAAKEFDEKYPMLEHCHVYGPSIDAIIHYIDLVDSTNP